MELAILVALDFYRYFEVSRKKTTEEFIAEAKAVHGDRFGYENSIYTGNKNKVTITCKMHGVFHQIAKDHLTGAGCKQCATKENADRLALGEKEFIARANKVHGDKYDYQNVIYKNANTKVEIICKQHGSFWQIPSSHLLAACGCPICGFERTAVCQRDTKEGFVQKATAIHGDKYLYGKFVYVTRNSKSIITCRVEGHGDFLQRASDHLSGNGCQICGREKLSETQSLGYESFVSKAGEIHKDKNYSYERFVYVNAHTKGLISCNKDGHGEFAQTPNNHLYSGKGCPKCFGNEKFTTEKFVMLAKALHGDKYDYSGVNYVNMHTKVLIACNEINHGVFEQEPNSHLDGQGCPKCSCGNISKPEIELFDFIKRHAADAVQKDKTVLGAGRHEVDVLVPSLKLAVEFNGVFFHSVDNPFRQIPVDYHFDKREKALANGIRLVSIWEDEWIKDREVTENKLLTILHNQEMVNKEATNVTLDLDYQNLDAYLAAGYSVMKILPAKQKRGRFTVYNSGMATLVKVASQAA